MPRFKIPLLVLAFSLLLPRPGFTQQRRPAQKQSPSAPASAPAAAAAPAPAPAPAAKKGISFYNVLLGFTTWTEQVSLSNAQRSDSAAANLFGNAITFEYEHYPHLRWGYYLVGSVLYGTANVGGSQSGVPYQLAGQTFFGTVLSARGGYRLFKPVAFTIGPVILYRSLSLPGAADVSVSSGSDMNYGATADMRIRLGNSWELRQEIGFLMVKATGYWSLGFGYKF